MSHRQNICEIDGCGKPRFARGWCSAHWARWRRHGCPLGGRTPEGSLRAFYEKALSYEGDECLTWPYGCTNGYARMSLGGKMRSVPRLICEHRHGPPPTPQHDAAHSCGRGHLGCVAQHHLSWKTRAENLADQIDHGTHHRGERQWLSKLTRSDVRQIRSLRGERKQCEIAAQFNISKQHVSAIMKRTTWAWLDAGEQS